MTSFLILLLYLAYSSALEDVPVLINDENYAKPQFESDYLYTNCSQRIQNALWNGLDDELNVAESDDRWLLPASNEDDLILTQVLFRHGERTPRNPYPRDPHGSISCWPEGRAQLTARGRRQARALGASLRRRYGGLLAEEEPSSWRRVRVISSAATRAIQSAGSLLAGILPPVAGNVWSELPWQPIPITTVERDADNFLQMHTKCPALQKDLETDKYNASNEKLYALMSYYTGRLITNDMAAENVFTCLDIEKQMGLQLPPWGYEHYQQLKEAAGRSLGASSNTPARARLRSGPLIGRLLNGFIASVVTTKEKLKILEDDDTNLYTPQVILYSGHDTSVAALLGALGVYNGVPPGFSSAVLWEMWRTNNTSLTPGIYYTQLWYSPSHGIPPTPLTIPGCGRKCPLTQLQSILSGYISKKWSKDCKIVVPKVVETEDEPEPKILTAKMPDHSGSISTTAAALTGTLGGFAVVAGLVILIRWRKFLKIHNHKEYQPILRSETPLRHFESIQSI